MTSIYLIMFIIILEHIKTSQVKNATLCSIKAYLAHICCQTNKQSCQKTRGGTEYTVLVNIKTNKYMFLFIYLHFSIPLTTPFYTLKFISVKNCSVHKKANFVHQYVIYC